MTSVKLASMELVARLFGEAWEHRRKRRRSVPTGLIVIAAAAAAGLLIGGLDHTPPRPMNQPVGAGSRFESPSRVLADNLVLFSPEQQLGDHCAAVNSVSCDRAVVMVRLKSPAASVVVSLDGRMMKLKRITRQTEDGLRFAEPFSPGTVFFGKLLPPRTVRVFAHPATETPISRPTYVSVRLLIDSADGSKVTTQLRVRAARVVDEDRGLS
jgi:hypothetical protein